MSGTSLASRNEGSAKSAILDFIQRVTTEGPDFVPVSDRVAAFDNDGALWVEQPLPPQFDFVFRHWAEEIKADPSMANQQPYKAIIEKDPAFFVGVATQDPAGDRVAVQGVWTVVGRYDTIVRHLLPQRCLSAE
jgi:hypothetical protein